MYGFLSVCLKLVHSSCLFIFSDKIMPFLSLRFYVGFFYVGLYCLFRKLHLGKEVSLHVISFNVKPRK